MKNNKTFINLVKEWISQILYWAILVGLVVFIAVRMIEASKTDQNVPEVFVAIFTLLLAGVTANLANQTAKGNKQARERERREKNDKLLNDIIEWAIKVAESAISRQKTNETQLWTTKLQYKIQMTKGTTYIKAFSYSIFEDLVNLVSDINEKLEDAIVELEKVIEYRKSKTIIQTTELFSTEGIKETEKVLKEAVEALLKKAAAINIKEAGFEVKEEKPVIDNITKKEPTLSELKDLIIRTRISPWGQGLLIAGFVQLGIFLALVLTAGFALSNQDVYKNILNTSGIINLVSGCILTSVGTLIIFFNRKVKKGKGSK
jgi:hypothetical protein